MEQGGGDQAAGPVTPVTPVIRYLINAASVSIGPKGFLLDKAQWIDRHDLFGYHCSEAGAK